jgi:hypothetical protein
MFALQTCQVLYTHLEWVFSRSRSLFHNSVRIFSWQARLRHDIDTLLLLEKEKKIVSCKTIIPTVVYIYNERQVNRHETDDSLVPFVP